MKSHLYSIANWGLLYVNEYFLMLWFILLVFTKACQDACITQMSSHLADLPEVKQTQQQHNSQPNGRAFKLNDQNGNDNRYHSKWRFSVRSQFLPHVADSN